MQSEAKVAVIVAIVSSVVATSVASFIVYGAAVSDSERKYRTMLENHFVQDHLEPDELTIIRIGNSSASQLLADGLMSLGAGISISTYSDFIVPDSPTKDTIYIFESNELRNNGLDNPEFLSFLKQAAANHSTLIVIGESSGVLYDALDEAAITHGNVVRDVELAGFKISEKPSARPIIMTSGNPDGKDQAMSVLELAREESDHLE